jgi:SAM-dependent methyltransferase
VAGADFLLVATIEEMIDRLGVVTRRFPRAADLGSATAMLADALVGSGPVDTVLRMDRVAASLAGSAHLGVVADIEALPFAEASLDLAVSALALHYVEDLPGALSQIRKALKPDGLFMAAMLAGDTLTELRESFAAAEEDLTGGASPRVIPFAELRALGALLQRAGFALPVIDMDRRTVRYSDALALMRDLRAMGAANPLVERSRRPLTRRLLLRAAEIYGERFSDPDGRVRATFDVVSLSGWAPHESQPKPLRPGSAKMRLADALNAVERPAGDKAG